MDEIIIIKQYVRNNSSVENGDEIIDTDFENLKQVISTNEDFKEKEIIKGKDKVIVITKDNVLIYETFGDYKKGLEEKS